MANWFPDDRERRRGVGFYAAAPALGADPEQLWTRADEHADPARDAAPARGPQRSETMASDLDSEKPKMSYMKFLYDKWPLPVCKLWFPIICFRRYRL